MKNNNKTKHLPPMGNYTKKAVENFENGIVNEHNFLEKVDTYTKNKRD